MRPVFGIDCFSRQAPERLPPGGIGDEVPDPHERTRAHQPRDGAVDIVRSVVRFQQQLRPPGRAVARDIGGHKARHIVYRVRKETERLLTRGRAERLSIAIRHRGRSRPPACAAPTSRAP